MEWKVPVSRRSKTSSQVVDERADAQVRLVRAPSRMRIADGTFEVEFGRWIREIGGSKVLRHCKPNVTVVLLPWAVGAGVLLPWFMAAGRVHLLLETAGRSVLVSPRESGPDRVLDALRDNGFNTKIHRVSGPLSIVACFFWPLIGSIARTRRRA
jgi:hypothetical protein